RLSIERNDHDHDRYRGGATARPDPQDGTGHADAKAYRTIIGHQEGRLAKPLTSLTVAEVLAAQLVWEKEWEMPSGAAGAYQIIRKTLLGLKKALGLNGRETFDAALQDRMA